MNNKLNAALDQADPIDRYESLRGRREMARGRETWCDNCRTWVYQNLMEEHLKEEDHVAAQIRADAWKV